MGGLFSLEYQNAPWSLAKVKDLLAHLWVPILVLGTAGTAFQLRIMRATLLEELNKMYVTATRVTGLSEFRLIMKYPVRLALNPIVSTLGWELTTVIFGAPIIGLVLSLPDTGPMFINALSSQDMYLAGAMLLIYCVLVMIISLFPEFISPTTSQQRDTAYVSGPPTVVHIFDENWVPHLPCIYGRPWAEIR